MVWHIVLGHLTNILHNFLADYVCAEGLLQQHVAAVFFIGQDSFDRGHRPFFCAKDSLDVIALQPVLQVPQAGAALISLVDFAHDFCLLWDDAELAVCIFFVTVKPVAWNFERSDLCMHLSAAPDVAGNGLALGLRHRAVHRNHKFTVRRQGVDILFFEENPDPKLSENARIVDAVERVAGKSLDGLCKDEVNLFLFALTDHPQELRALFRGCAGDALIRKNPSHCPFLVGHDFVGVVFALRFIAAGLFFFLGRDAAIRCNAKLFCDRSGLL